MQTTSDPNLTLKNLAVKGTHPVQIRSPHQAHDLARAVLSANPVHEPNDFFVIWLDDDNRMLSFTHLPGLICPLQGIRHPDICTTWRWIKKLKPTSSILVTGHTGYNPKPSREEMRMYVEYWMDIYSKTLFPIDLLILSPDSYWSLTESVADFYSDEEDFRTRSELYVE